MGKVIKIRLLGLILLLLFTQGCSTGSRSRLEIVSGTIRLVGNEPFAEVVLTPETGKGGGEEDYLLIGPLRDELRKRYQGRIVTLSGNACESPTPRFTRCFKPQKIVAEGKEQDE